MRQQEVCGKQKREVESVLRALITQSRSLAHADSQSQQRIRRHVRGRCANAK